MASGSNPSTVPTTLDFMPSDDLQMIIEKKTDIEETQDNQIFGWSDARKDSPGRELEEALETHEVIEINKFTERKEWIEEKIKLLENMPPVEIFAPVVPEGLPPSLPTRAQLDYWLEEHDKIEKETEIFDAGDMSKLKKLTKAATRRNLSPEDTDLIELTLTTLLALDRLLHLLRNRSEQLELLGLRITWEDQRVIAWKERRQILEDIKSFLCTRARWSIDVYETLNDQAPSPYLGSRFMSPPPGPGRPSSALSLRRDSVASVSSESSIAGLSLLSRSARFKLAETLSHDAAILSGRLTTLNHAKVMAAGKTLDKLIDTSRKPVPDEILDEQDTLEDKAVKELESVGKFVMAIVMQWKRADEYYNDIIRDQGVAKALLSELANATLQHPSQRLDLSFMTRAQALTKRLALKANPKQSFLRPLHPLFPEQAAANDVLIETLAVEFTDAVKLSNEAEVDALEYHRKTKITKEAEDTITKMNDFREELETIMRQLTGYIQTSNEHGDPTPPDLQSESCLDATRHAAYVALAPAIFQKFEELEVASGSALNTANQSLLRLKTLSGIDPSFQKDFANIIKQLQSERHDAKIAKEDMEAKIIRLKEARRLWAILNDITDKTEDIAIQISECMKAQRWKLMGNPKYALPPTPDPDNPLDIPIPLTILVPDELLSTLTAFDERLRTEFVVPFTKLQPLLGPFLSNHLRSSSEGVTRYIKDSLELITLWQSIIDQSTTMAYICRETEEFIHRIVTLQSKIEDTQDGILRGDISLGTIEANELQFTSLAKELEKPVEDFISLFPKRILFVSPNAISRKKPRSNSVSSSDHYLHRLKEKSIPEPSVDIFTLNSDVRLDSNGFALRLTSAMQAVGQSRQDLHFSGIAKHTDCFIEKLGRVLTLTEHEMVTLKSSFNAILVVEQERGSTEVFDGLTVLLKDYDTIFNRYTNETSTLIPSIRQALQTFETMDSSRFDSPFYTGIISVRLKSGKEALEHADEVESDILHFRETLVAEMNRKQERLRIEKEKLLIPEEEPIEHSFPSKSNGPLQESKEMFQEGKHMSIILNFNFIVLDIFGLPLPKKSISLELTNIQSYISTLGSRLNSFISEISVVLHPEDISAALPNLEQVTNFQYTFSILGSEIKGLPFDVNRDINAESSSIRSEFEKARELMERLTLLGEISKKIAICDNAFSDLLEHVDSYPASPPVQFLASAHISDSRIPCEEQLKARLIFSTDQMDSLAQAAVTLNDSRVFNEQTRLRQTLLELRAMCIDRINGTHSRPASTASSTRSSNVASSVISTPKSKPAPKPRLPSQETNRLTRRSISGSQDPISRPSTHLSNRSHMSNRSVSGPSTTSSLFSPTFASRQRTISLASTNQPVPPAVRTRKLSKRPVSPTQSEISGKHRGTWARAPRQSFGSNSRSSSVEPRKRKAYIPNPKSKLDVAVGHVINNFKLPVTMQIAEEGWKDQSGKYWIGDDEPKLCFCRILRSQTVMVRVGGGWCELSKFLKGHFADLLAELPPSPPRNEERWISSIILREESPVPFIPKSSMTPEPKVSALLPSLQLSTPSGTSPRSIRTTSTSPESKSPGLTPFQYMRRADAPIRPSTPTSKSPLRLKPNNTPHLHRAIAPPRPHYSHSSLVERHYLKGPSLDDVVITSLRPTNDYKTVDVNHKIVMQTLKFCYLRLPPATIVEICSSSYQQAVLKTLSDKNLQITKQLENLVREAYAIDCKFTTWLFLGSKRGIGPSEEQNYSSVLGLERELEDEKRKNKENQALSREKDKEYQKLKAHTILPKCLAQLDKLKRKTLLGSGLMTADAGSVGENLPVIASGHQHSYSGQVQTGNLRGYSVPTGSGINRIADNMETFKIQRTPVKHGRPVLFSDFRTQVAPQRVPQRPVYEKGNISDTSENEVDSLPNHHQQQSMRGIQAMSQRGPYPGMKMRTGIEVQGNGGSLH
ncbi:hypothetical protein Clacol_001652 [Clathrus columnatus]|uniref:GAR domain-containing protein n=1 Tax=Clathrus columnatus TaxID=1419009 RepID=A0AAV5A6B3_9AGAM|nr:hypothetical protein Clacol_001652 [Clathrus columnatus]